MTLTRWICLLFVVAAAPLARVHASGQAIPTLTVVALGWVVARDFRQSAEAADQLYARFGAGLDLIDDMLFETEEVRRILLYALHTSDANRQLAYVDQSRSAEARVRRLLENRSPMLSTP